jgi:hypothetical protein
VSAHGNKEIGGEECERIRLMDEKNSVMFPSQYARNITSCMNFKLLLVVAFRQTLCLL